MTSFRILPQASEELEAAVAFYNTQQAGLGTAFLNEFEIAVQRILEPPLAARIARGSIHDTAVSPLVILTTPGLSLQLASVSVNSVSSHNAGIGLSHVAEWLSVSSDTIGHCF